MIESCPDRKGQIWPAPLCIISFTAFLDVPGKQVGWYIEKKIRTVPPPIILDPVLKNVFFGREDFLSDYHEGSVIKRMYMNKGASDHYQLRPRA